MVVRITADEGDQCHGDVTDAEAAIPNALLMISIGDPVEVASVDALRVEKFVVDLFDVPAALVAVNGVDRPGPEPVGSDQVEDPVDHEDHQDRHSQRTDKNEYLFAASETGLAPVQVQDLDDIVSMVLVTDLVDEAHDDQRRGQEVDQKLEDLGQVEAGEALLGGLELHGIHGSLSFEQVNLLVHEGYSCLVFAVQLVELGRHQQAIVAAESITDFLGTAIKILDAFDVEDASLGIAAGEGHQRQSDAADVAVSIPAALMDIDADDAVELRGIQIPRTPETEGVPLKAPAVFRMLGQDMEGAVPVKALLHQTGSDDHHGNTRNDHEDHAAEDCELLTAAGSPEAVEFTERADVVVVEDTHHVEAESRADDQQRHSPDDTVDVGTGQTPVGGLESNRIHFDLSCLTVY